MAEKQGTPTPKKHSDAALNNNISCLLQSWGLQDLESAFKTHQIEARALFCLTEKDICELIPKIGRRAIFRSSLIEWRRNNKQKPKPYQIPRLITRLESNTEENIPIPEPVHVPVVKEEQMVSDEDEQAEIVEPLQNNEDSSIEGVVSEEEHPEEHDSVPELFEEKRYGVLIPPKSDQGICNINVREILNNSYEGQQVIAFYKVNGTFDYSHRRRLVSVIINEVIRTNRWLIQEDFARISREIIKIFPREEEATYYTARNGLKNPKGCLYNKFLNLTRKLRQEGILQYRNNVHLMPERISARHSGETKCYREENY